MQLLAAAAVLALRKVKLIVTAHLWGQAGDVIPPSGKDFPYDRFSALTHKLLQPDRLQDFRLGSE